jgi:hypothetical protein
MTGGDPTQVGNYIAALDELDKGIEARYEAILEPRIDSRFARVDKLQTEQKVGAKK